jgi:hypothetical protein
MVNVWDIVDNPFGEWQTKVVQIIEMPNMVLYGFEKKEVDLNTYNSWPDKIISTSKTVRQPKRGEIIQVRNFWTNRAEDWVFIAEIQEEYDWKRYLVDVEWHPITIRKEIRQKLTEEPM